MRRVSRLSGFVARGFVLAGAVGSASRRRAPLLLRRHGTARNRSAPPLVNGGVGETCTGNGQSATRRRLRAATSVFRARDDIRMATAQEHSIVHIKRCVFAER
jgi:hypothetical protein